MIPLIGAVFGFLGSFIPHILKIYQDKQDKKHELKLLEMQMEANKLGHLQKLEEINVRADVEEAKQVYEYAKPTQASLSGSKWIDGLNGVLFALTNTINATVRPFLTYGITGFYVKVKLALLEANAGNIMLIWTETDMTVFSTIIFHWFGQRMASKWLGKK